MIVGVFIVDLKLSGPNQLYEKLPVSGLTIAVSLKESWAIGKHGSKLVSILSNTGLTLMRKNVSFVPVQLPSLVTVTPYNPLLAAKEIEGLAPDNPSGPVH